METPDVTIKQTPKKIEIPEYLVYETMDGKPIPYQGFEDVLRQEKKPEDIMGSSGLQSVIVSAILRHLYQALPEEKYEIVTNEAGLHLGKHDNLSTDIGIYLRDDLPVSSLNNQYLKIPPHIAIEVDTKASMVTFQEPSDYFNIKTQKLLDFGVKKVIWIFTESKKLLYATAQADWTTSGWSKEINLVDDIVFSLPVILKKRGLDV